MHNGIVKHLRKKHFRKRTALETENGNMTVSAVKMVRKKISSDKRADDSWLNVNG